MFIVAMMWYSQVPMRQTDRKTDTGTDRHRARRRGREGEARVEVDV